MISYEEIYKKCEEMSSYEGARAQDTDGESLYPVVHITEQDHPRIKQFANMGAEFIGRAIRYVLNDLAINDEGITYVLLTDNSLAVRTNYEKEISNAICSYVLWQWLLDKLPQRADVYRQTQEVAIQSIPRIFHKVEPTLPSWT